MRERIPGAGLLLLICAAYSLACGQSSSRPYNVLLITVDSLRTDRLGYAGHRRPTSAAVDALARESVLFENSYSQSGWTLPSVATLLTGRYPSQHGATNVNRSLERGIPTLATILQAQGYETRAYVSHVLLGPRYGLAAGFDSYDHSVLDVGHPHQVATAEPLTDLVLEDLETIQQPFFLWLHYFDPHFAYLSHPEWVSFGDSKKGRYDGEVAHTDRQIGRVLEALSTGPWSANTVIVFTADHGEEFRDHGGKFHFTLYEEVIRVPLLIKAPRLEPKVSPVPTQQIDILPTVLGALGIEPPRDIPGRDALAPKFASQPIFLERDRPRPFHQRGVIAGTRKLTVVEIDRELSPEGHEPRNAPSNLQPGIYLYDLKSDPGERHNLFDPSDPTSLTLLRILEDHFSRQTATGEEVDVDDQMRSKLRSLGYLD